MDFNTQSGVSEENSSINPFNEDDNDRNNWEESFALKINSLALYGALNNAISDTCSCTEAALTSCLHSFRMKVPLCRTWSGPVLCRNQAALILRRCNDFNIKVSQGFICWLFALREYELWSIFIDRWLWKRFEKRNVYVDENIVVILLTYSSHSWND